jgi:hypothetical protein
MPDPVSLGDLVAAYSKHRPKELPTLRTVLKTIVLPALGRERLDIDSALTETSASMLYGVFAPGHRAWADSVRTNLPRSHTYQKAYLRAIKRLIVFGEMARLVSPDEYEITPAWRSLIATLAPTVSGLAPAKRSRLKAAFKRLAKWATACALEPDQFLPGAEVATAPGLFRASLPSARDAEFFVARRAWNYIVGCNPDLGLPAWEPAKARQGLPRQAWPGCVTRGLDAFCQRDGLGNWSDFTKKQYEQRISSYLGALERLGVDIAGLLAGVDEGRDAFRILFQGQPDGFPARCLEVHAHELSHDLAYKHALLAAMKHLDRLPGGRSSEANPMLAAAVVSLAGEQKLGSAAALVTRAIAINRNFLGLAPQHVDWLVERSRSIGLAALRRPSRYSRKKRLVFRSPDLWIKLVGARTRIRDWTQSRERAWQAMPDNGARARAWAVALRNEVIYWLLLCYPIRVGNLIAIQLDVHYDPIEHSLFISAEETKNLRNIEYELPIEGALGDLRALMDRYLTEARPILLNCRASDRLFVSCEKGQPWLSRQAVHDILAGLSRRFLAGVLPKGMANLNSHMPRHAVATYHLAIRGDLNLAAQMLNDAPSTITRNYADILENRKAATKEFLSNFKATS